MNSINDSAIAHQRCYYPGASPSRFTADSTTIQAAGGRSLSPMREANPREDGSTQILGASRVAVTKSVADFTQFDSSLAISTLDIEPGTSGDLSRCGMPNPKSRI